jgi:hypothetical protein
VRYWYKPTGERSAEVRGAGTGGFSTTHYYDAAMRPSVLADNLPVAGADVSFSFGWNPAGQVAALARDNDSYAFTAAVPARTYAADGLSPPSGNSHRRPAGGRRCRRRRARWRGGGTRCGR